MTGIIMTIRFSSALLFCLLSSLSAQAVERVCFVGRFGDKVLLDVDGARRIVGVGATTPEGVRLVSVDDSAATVSYSGLTQSLEFSQAVLREYRPAATTEARIAADANGSFRTSGTINGRVVNLLVDTGATYIAMNGALAADLGIDYRYEGNPIDVSTASGVASAYEVKLKSVRVGEIEMTNVDGVVVEGGYPVDVLLGMSFLKAVHISRSDGLLVLKKTN